MLSLKAVTPLKDILFQVEENFTLFHFFFTLKLFRKLAGAV
jgi:hypothetical protein